MQYWNNAVVVQVLGANPPFHVMNGYLRRIWKEYSIDKLLQIQRGVFLVRFGEGTSRDTVIQRGVPTFDEKPVVIVPWQEDMELRADVHSIPVWVQFPALPLKYWSSENLCCLANQLGRPLDIDDLTLQRNRGQFARLKVLMEITEAVPESVKFVDEHGRLCEQRVFFEWRLVQCTGCKGYGHTGSECQKAKAQTRVPKQGEGEKRANNGD